MKAISIWNPFALLIVKGFKVFETRTWAAPASVIGQTIGIASTKSIRPEQRAHYDFEHFRAFYEATGLPELEHLPHGFMLGTAVLDSVELMTPEFMDEVSLEEQAYGFWEPGNYAWRLTNPAEFAEPIPVRGAQGLYEWKGLYDAETNNSQATQADRLPEDREEGPPALRSHLRIV